MSACASVGVARGCPFGAQDTADARAVWYGPLTHRPVNFTNSPVRLCWRCRSPGHDKSTCPATAAEVAAVAAADRERDARRSGAGERGGYSEIDLTLASQAGGDARVFVEGKFVESAA